MFPETNSISIPGLTRWRKIPHHHHQIPPRPPEIPHLHRRSPHHQGIGHNLQRGTKTAIRHRQYQLHAGLTESLFRFCRSLRMQSQANQTTTPGLLPRGKGTFKRRVLSPHKSRAGIAERPPLLNNPDHLQYRNPDQRTGMYYRPSGAKRRGRSKLQRQEPANFHSP